MEKARGFLVSLFDPLTPEERKRIDDIRSGEIIDATRDNLQSLLDYMIGKKVDSLFGTLDIIASGSVVIRIFTDGIEITVCRYYKSNIPDEPLVPNRVIESCTAYHILIAFPNQDLNLRPAIYKHHGRAHYQPYAPYPLDKTTRRKILRLIRNWKKREGF